MPVLSSAFKLDADDPVRDGWLTEAFTQEAVGQLNQLGLLVVSDEPIQEEEIASQLATDDLSSDQLVPQSTRIVFDDGLLRIERATGSVSASANLTGPTLTRLRHALVPLRKWLASVPEARHFKFKLFRVALDDEDPTQATTRQYAHFSGRSDHESREVNATWIVQWQRHQDRPPTIRSIQLQRFEQTTLQQKNLFADCTESVLGQNKIYSVALTPGIPYWRKRFEQQLGVYNFGHHGLSVGDVNGDGMDDLYICQTGGLPNHLLIQQPDGALRDVSSMARVDYLDNTRSALFLDLDNDDDQDLVLALTTGLLFLENDGQARFQLRARIPSVRQAFSLAAADYDRDGRLDLYVCVYYGTGDDISELPVPVPYFDATNGGQNYLIRNEGDWRFNDVTERVGLDDDNRRFSFAAAWEDYDNDGDSDLIVVNDFGPNHLFQNNNGRFRNVAAEVGLIDGAFGMSATFGDYNRDGYADLYVSNMFSAAGNRVTYQPQFKSAHVESTKARFQHLARGNSLFCGLPGGQFRDVSVAERVTMGRWSWGSLFADINNDGWEDLLVANGFVTGDSKDDL